MFALNFYWVCASRPRPFHRTSATEIGLCGAARDSTNSSQTFFWTLNAFEATCRWDYSAMAFVTWTLLQLLSFHKRRKDPSGCAYCPHQSGAQTKIEQWLAAKAKVVWNIKSWSLAGDLPPGLVLKSAPLCPSLIASCSSFIVFPVFPAIPRLFCSSWMFTDTLHCAWASTWKHASLFTRAAEHLTSYLLFDPLKNVFTFGTFLGWFVIRPPRRNRRP